MQNQDPITAQLLGHVREGDERSFEMLYRQWVSRLYAFVLRYVKSEQVADDVVQETFVQVWNRHESLDPQRSFKAYLFTISYHLILRELRRQVRHPLMEQYLDYVSHLEGRQADGLAELGFDEFTQALARAKAHLTPRQRQIFEMSKEADLPVQEIARRLDIKPQVVRNQLSAALATVRRHLSPYEAMLLLLFLKF